jgi:hypothetical protein
MAHSFNRETGFENVTNPPAIQCITRSPALLFQPGEDGALNRISRAESRQDKYTDEKQRQKYARGGTGKTPIAGGERTTKVQKSRSHRFRVAPMMDSLSSR